MSGDRIVKMMFRMACLILIPVFTGCATVNKPAETEAAICSDALSRGLGNYSDVEVVGLMDQARERREEKCWQSIVKACLDTDRPVPQAHLKRAVKVFNRQDETRTFHKAVFRYFLGISSGEAAYRQVDRKLLETYCRYVINQAQSRQDEQLTQARLLCKKLDKDLYVRLFD